MTFEKNDDTKSRFPNCSVPPLGGQEAFETRATTSVIATAKTGLI